ncbi:Pre-rRNA-processing protein pro-1 [Trichinella spiralis]|uniref:Pre-rRNA-processing protein pro-1 n=1 Tax=Trichinella spiralis TaxID=6334 RepID=A0A0V1BS94_TRISP|nr:Pre-rRNA-processing protein pro-1 [Trichinella spiralis]
MYTVGYDVLFSNVACLVANVDQFWCVESVHRIGTTRRELFRFMQICSAMPCALCNEYSRRIQRLQSDLAEKEKQLSILNEKMTKQRLQSKAKFLKMTKLLSPSEGSVVTLQNGDHETVEEERKLNDLKAELANLRQQLIAKDKELSQHKRQRVDKSTSAAAVADDGCGTDRGLIEELHRCYAEIKRKNFQLIQLNDELRDREDELNNLADLCQEKDELLNAKVTANQILLKQLALLTNKEKQDKCIETDSCLFETIEQQKPLKKTVNVCPPGRPVAFYRENGQIDLENSSIATDITDSVRLLGDKSEAEERGNLGTLNDRLSGMLETIGTLQNRLAALESSCPDTVSEEKVKLKKRLKRVTFDLSSDSLRVELLDKEQRLQQVETMYTESMVENEELRMIINDLERQLEGSLNGSERADKDEACAYEAEIRTAAEEKVNQLRKQCKASLLKAKAEQAVRIRQLEQNVGELSAEVEKRDVELGRCRAELQRLAATSAERVERSDLLWWGRRFRDDVANLSAKFDCFERSVEQALDHCETRLEREKARLHGWTSGNEWKRSSSSSCCCSTDVVDWNTVAGEADHQHPQQQQQQPVFASFNPRRGSKSSPQFELMTQSLSFDQRRPPSSLSTSTTATSTLDWSTAFVDKLEQLRKLHRSLDHFSMLRNNTHTNSIQNETIFQYLKTDNTSGFSVNLPELLLVCASSTDNDGIVAAYNPRNGSTVWLLRGMDLIDKRPQKALLVHGSCVFISFTNKPLMQAYNLNNKAKAGLLSCLQGPLTDFAVSADGSLFFGAIDNCLFTWRTTDGMALTSIEAHHSSIVKVCALQDNSFVITASQDGFINVWNIGKLVTPMPLSNAAPLPIIRWTAHHLPITDMQVGNGGITSRVYSTSLDRTLTVHSLFTGKLEMEIHFTSPLTACATDLSDSKVFVGSNVGEIWLLCLFAGPLNKTVNFDLLDEKYKLEFIGHKCQVTSLTTDISGTQLASAAFDLSIRLWDVSNGQCMRIITLESTPTFLSFVPNVPMFTREIEHDDSGQVMLVHKFDRNVNRDANSSVIPLRRQAHVALPIADFGIDDDDDDEQLLQHEQQQQEIDKLKYQLDMYVKINKSMRKMVSDKLFHIGDDDNEDRNDDNVGQNSGESHS